MTWREKLDQKSFPLILVPSTGNNFKPSQCENWGEKSQLKSSASCFIWAYWSISQRNHILAVMKGVVSLKQMCTGGGHPTELPLSAKQHVFVRLCAVDFLLACAGRGCPIWLCYSCFLSLLWMENQMSLYFIMHQLAFSEPGAYFTSVKK